MTARLTILLATAIGLGALLAGCGGGSDSSADTVSTSSLSKAQFAKKAEAACTKGRDEILAYESPSGTGSSEKVQFQEAVTDSIVPALEGVVDNVRALGAPKGDAPQIEAFLESMEAGIKNLEQEKASMSSLSDVEGPLKDSGKLAREYGIEACSFGR